MSVGIKDKVDISTQELRGKRLSREHPDLFALSIVRATYKRAVYSPDSIQGERNYLCQVCGSSYVGREDESCPACLEYALDNNLIR